MTLIDMRNWNGKSLDPFFEAAIALNAEQRKDPAWLVTHEQAKQLALEWHIVYDGDTHTQPVETLLGYPILVNRPAEIERAAQTIRDGDSAALIAMATKGAEERADAAMRAAGLAP